MGRCPIYKNFTRNKIFLFLFIPSEKKNFHSGYLSIRQTNVIKGFFLLLVFMSHFCQYAPVNTKADYFYQLWRMHSGQLLVTLFLFYSGYGTFITVKSKGIAYIKKMPVHRILKTLVNFDAAVCVYLIMQFFRGNSYSVKKILFSLIYNTPHCRCHTHSRSARRTLAGWQFSDSAPAR